MPLWDPGSWQLASSFPRRQLQPASGIWAMAAAAAAAAADGSNSSNGGGDAIEQLLDSWLIEDDDQQDEQIAADGSSSSSSFLVSVKSVNDAAVMQFRVHGGLTVLRLMQKIQSRTGGVVWCDYSCHGQTCCCLQLCRVQHLAVNLCPLLS
jgi:hypothetical protein